HPARTISIKLSGEGGRSLSERVYSQCWMPFGQRRQICCEQVELTASDTALLDLAPVVRPLAVPDMPVILWCRSQRLLGMPEFAAMSAMAQKVIIDSEGLDMRKVALLGAGQVVLGDLAWTRLTRWRETLAQVFENKTNLAQLDSLTDLTVTHTASLRNTALYVAAWIADALPKVKVTLQPDEKCDSLCVKLSGGGLTVEMEREDERLVVKVNGLRNCTNLPMYTDYLLMREELRI